MERFLKSFTNVSLQQFKQKANEKNVLIVDTRSKEEFAKWNVKNSVNIQLQRLDENLNVFEDKFYSFAEIKDNVMLYEGTFKAGLLSAVRIYRGDCQLFNDKNCFTIKTTEIGDIEVVLIKKGKQYIIVGITILTA